MPGNCLKRISPERGPAR